MTTAIVVARAGSIRLPGKALLPFAGTTLIGHKVRTLLSSWTISRVVVNSDSHEIRDAAMAEGAEAIDGRDYGGDTHEMIADSCRKAGGDLIVWAHPTNPLVTAGTYDRAVTSYLTRDVERYDSLLSVYRVQRHAWFDGKPLNYDPTQRPHPLAAATGPVWFQDGSIFIQSRERFLETRYFFGSRPMLFEVPPDEVSDVDYHGDYKDACFRAAARGSVACTLGLPSPGRCGNRSEAPGDEVPV